MLIVDHMIKSHDMSHDDRSHDDRSHDDRSHDISLIKEVSIQWNLSIVNTIGTGQSVLIIEVSSSVIYMYITKSVNKHNNKWYMCVHVYMWFIPLYVQWNLSILNTIGTGQSVLIIEVSSFQK